MQSFNKALLPEKVILSGADCFHLVLDKHAQKHGAGGNVMRKIFYFDNPLSFEKIDALLKSSPVIYWLCNIKLDEGSLFQLPCWRYKDKGNQVVFKQHLAPVENEVPAEISSRDINIRSERFIEADLVNYPSGSCAFILSWNHILLDARGTTLLFDHLNKISENKAEDFELFFPGKEKKTGLFTHIRNMYKVKAFVQRSARPPVCSVAEKNKKSEEGITAVKIISFSVAETKMINENAFKTGSRFGPTLYLIACCSHIISRLSRKKNKTGDLWLPVPYDGRLKGAMGPLISNCVSFLFYRIPQNELTSIPQTVKHLSDQMMSQIKDGIPQRYTMFLSMMRHVPLWLYYFLVNKTGKGVFASFLYTSTGDNFNDLHSLFGEPIRDIKMIPALTFPPGLTFVFLKHDDELSVNIAYSPDIINAHDLDFIEQQIKQILPLGQ
jgi:hypothetical protein